MGMADTVSLRVRVSVQAGQGEQPRRRFEPIVTSSGPRDNTNVWRYHLPLPCRYPDRCHESYGP